MKRVYAEFMAYGLVIAAGVVSLLQVSRLETRMPFDVGPAFFPGGLAVVMIVLAAIGALRTARARNEEVFEIEGGRKVALTLGATVALFVLWSVVGHFFLLAFLYLAGLLLLFFADGALTRRHVVWILVGSALSTGIAYVVFTQVIYTKF